MADVERSGAELMRNRCAFTSRDMGAEWADAFAYAVVLGWDDEDDPDNDGAMREVAERHGWDPALMAFLRDAHERFRALEDGATRG